MKTKGLYCKVKQEEENPVVPLAGLKIILRPIRKYRPYLGRAGKPEVWEEG
jgi:hypothetical protein